MWITRQKYEALVRAAAETESLRHQNGALLTQIEHERHRAENAVDALLVSKSALPITPQAAPKVPEVGMFDDDPEELERLMRDMKTDPSILIREGVGDETHA